MERSSQQLGLSEADEEDVYSRYDDSHQQKGGSTGSQSDAFLPEYFLGDWLDNLGHEIQVVPAESRGSSRRGNANRLAFSAVLHKPGVPDKRFIISKDKSKREWTCGNGILVRSDSDMENLHWRAADGRTSSWSRAPPEGPVYFDAAPELQDEHGDHLHAWFAADPNCHDPAAGQIIFVLSEAAEGLPAAGEWAPTDLIVETICEEVAPGAAAGLWQQNGEVGGGGATGAGAAAGLNPSAPEFVPSGFGAAAAAAAGGGGDSRAMRVASPPLHFREGASPSLNFRDGSALRSGISSPAMPMLPSAAASPSLGPVTATSSDDEHLASAQRMRWCRTPTPSPKMMLLPSTAYCQRPRASPKMAPSPLPSRLKWGRTPTPSPQLGPLPSLMLPPPMPLVPPVVSLTEESPDARAVGNRLEWCLADNWGKLSRFPKDFCISSPMFGVEGAADMQLAFYPNGSGSSERGYCTVALTREPQSAGIKFEFSVNGRSIGPKVCRGRRYLGDYPRPFDDSEESKAQQVVVCMQVTEILSGFT